MIILNDRQSRQENVTAHHCTVHFEHTNFADIDSPEIIASYTGLQVA